jgi:hypothetical protein
MSDLRPWTEEGATDAESSLLKAARRERAPSNTRIKVLGLAAAVATTSAATNIAATTATATKSGGLAGLTKLLAVSLLGGGVIAGGVFVRETRQTPASRVASPSPAARPPEPGGRETGRAPLLPAPEPPSQSPNAAPSTPAVPAPTAVAHAETPAHHVLPGAPDNPLSREVAALEGAHQALAERNPDEALRLLDRYRLKFPAGALSSEATVLRVQALLMHGDRTGARALADAFAAAHPESPFGRRLEDLIRGGQP